MKRILFSFAALSMLLYGCEDLNNLEQFGDPTVGGETSSEIIDRLDKLESDVKTLQNSVSELQRLVEALQNNDYIIGVTPLTENGTDVGYLIEFAKGDDITIYHGKNGADGADGKDDGVNTSVAPEIGVRQDTDGVWYWTLDGEWLLDDSGNKVKAVGVDGKDGEDGKDGATGATGATGAPGITPEFRIHEDYWQVSYDNGQTWEVLGKATGEDGKDGADGGASIFADVTWDSTSVYFKLTDGTTITIPKTSGTGLSIEFDVEQGTAVVPGSTLKIKYTITGGDENTLVRATNPSDDFSCYVAVKPIDSSTGYIYITAYELFEGPDDPLRDEIFEDGDLGNITYEEFYNGSMLAFIIVTDGHGNQISKALTFVEGVLASVQDAYVVDAEGGRVNAVVGTNVMPGSYKVEISEHAQSWLSYVPTRASMREDVLSFAFLPNEADKFRKASVNLLNDMGQVLETFFIIQRSTIAGEAVRFADADVERICVGRYDKNLDGVLTYEELAVVTDIDDLFLLDKNITSFDEFEYFTSVTEIPEEFLANCTKLTSVKLPESVTRIYSRAFANCSSLTEIVLPESLCHSGDSYMEDAYYAEGWFEDCSSLTSVQLPSKLVYLPNRCFRNCRSLKTITIPEDMETIGASCFGGCTSLSDIKNAAAVKNIGGYAFGNCVSLTEFDLSGLTAGDDYYGSLLGAGAFAGSGLVSVTIPSTVTVILEATFEDCQNLTEVILHDNITRIENNAFAGTSSLLSIDLPLNLKFIDYYAFKSSAIRGKLIEGTNVTALTIPAGVTAIDVEAFYDTNVTAVKMLGIYPPEGGWNMFDDGTCIYVPSESLDVYSSAGGWDEYPILSYEMMDMSLEFSCEFAGSCFLRFTDGRVGLRNYVDYTLNGDESMMENVSEYGIYFYNDYDGTLYFPMDTLNVSLQAYNTLEPRMYSSDPYEFIATADARMGAYVMLSNGQYIRYGQTDLKYVYDDKPSVTYYEAVCHTTAVREDSVVRYDVVDTVYLQVKGAYWMDSVERVFCRDDGEDFYYEWSGYYDDNAWYGVDQFSHYGDAYSVTEYFIMHLTNGETMTSNFYRETFDENWNMVQIISDTYPEITKSASSVQKTRKSLSRGSERVPTREPVFVRLNQEPYLQSGDSRVGIVKK